MVARRRSTRTGDRVNASGAASASRRSRSTCRSTVSAMRSSRSPSSTPSAAVTSPRCRSGKPHHVSSRGMAPTGTARHAVRIASPTQRACVAPPTRLVITAATLRAGSKRSKPSTVAAALRDCAPASTISTTGAPSHFATCAVEPASLVPSSPSKQPMTPSMIAMSTSAACRATVASTASRPHIHPSRLYDERPDATACRPGSMKSGPTLNGCTESPRRRSARSRPSVIDVFPTPVATPATTRTRLTPGRPRPRT